MLPNVRFSRSPGKAPQTQADAPATTLVEASPSVAHAPPSERATAQASRVLFGRTPDHLLRQTWVERQAIETPIVVEETATAFGAEADCSQDDATDVDIEVDVDIEPALEASSAAAEPSEGAITPFSFISDSAFWEFAPEAGQGDAGPAVNKRRAELNEGVRELLRGRLARQAAPAARDEAVPVMASEAPPVAEAPRLAWQQTYSVSLNLNSFGGLAPKPAQAPQPPVEPVIASKPAIASKGIAVSRTARAKVVPQAVAPVVPAPQPSPGRPQHAAAECRLARRRARGFRRQGRDHPGPPRPGGHALRA
jgi:hypothetical protein